MKLQPILFFPLAIATTTAIAIALRPETKPLYFYRISIYSDFYLTSRPLSEYRPCPPVVPRLYGPREPGQEDQDGVDVWMKDHLYQHITYRYDVTASGYGRYSFVRDDDQDIWALLNEAERQVGRCDTKMLDYVACVDADGKKAGGQWLFECHFEGR